MDSGLVVSIGIVLFAPLAERVARRRFDPFEPIAVFAVVYGLMFVVRPAAMIFTDSRVYEGPRATLDVSAGFTEMLALATVGAIAFVVCYELPLGRKLAAGRRSPAQDLHTGRVVLVSFLMALAGVTSFVLLLAANGGFTALKAIFRAGNTVVLEGGAGSTYASFLFLVVSSATLVLLVCGLERRNVWLVVSAVCLGGLFLIQAFPLGNRLALLPFLGGIFLLYYVRRLSRPSVATIVLVGAVALLASTFLSDLRARTTRGETIVDTVVRATSPARLASSFTTGPDTEMAPVLSAALSLIPEELPHTYGRTVFGDLVVRPIPRALWQGKPLPPREKLEATIWPIEYARGTINPEFSALLYFYWDFSYLGIVLGLGAYGLLARSVYEYFLRHQSHPYVQVLYSLALWFVVIALRDSPVDTFVRAVFVLGPVCAVFLIAGIPIGTRSDNRITPKPSSVSS